VCPICQSNEELVSLPCCKECADFISRRVQVHDGFDSKELGVPFSFESCNDRGSFLFNWAALVIFIRIALLFLLSIMQFDMIILVLDIYGVFSVIDIIIYRMRFFSILNIDVLRKFPIGKSMIPVVYKLIINIVKMCTALVIISELAVDSHKIFISYWNHIVLIIMLIEIVELYCVGKHQIAIQIMGSLIISIGSYISYFLGEEINKFVYIIIISPSLGISLYMTSSIALSLLGRVAPDEIINEIREISHNHHPLIQCVEKAITFQLGYRYLTEVHIVLPGHIPVELSHWIGESLQLKLETMDRIERAWVHVDYECIHDHEHLLCLRINSEI